MASTIPLLRRDHVNFSLLMNVLERQVNIADEGGVPSVDLIKSILRYLHDYPRKVHHPKEDMIYGMLLHHMAGNSANIYSVIQDHRELAERLAPLDAAVNALNVENAASIEQFSYHAKRFIEKEREHITIEEGHLYPSAVHMLSAEEWHIVDQFMASEADSLFGEKVAHPYDLLKDAILEIDESLRAGAGSS